MNLYELHEKTKHASFAFGRCNPPTIGHGQLINTVANSANGGDYFIFVSQTQDAKSNPLDYSTKIKFLHALFPAHASHIVNNPALNTIMAIAQSLYQSGYRRVTFVAGSDRLADFQKLLNSYNGVEGKAHFYDFDTIDYVSSGEREDGAEGVAGVSASDARSAAKQGNIQAFSSATGAGKLAPELYQAVRKGMVLETKAINISLIFDSYEINPTKIVEYFTERFRLNSDIILSERYLPRRGITRLIRDINESEAYTEITPFIELLNSLDYVHTVKVGDLFSVLEFEIRPSWKEIDVNGLMIPKKIVSIILTPEGKINYIKFDDNSQYPRLTSITSNNKPIIHAAYFSSSADATHALTLLSLKVPANWDMHIDPALRAA